MTAARNSFAFKAPARTSWRKRLAVLLAAITVPAMAATGGVGVAFAILCRDGLQ